jgi:hypothetical protein
MRSSGATREGLGSGRSRRSPYASANRPMGTFSRNTHRQEAVIRKPPSTGPRIGTPPLTIAVTLVIRRRSAGG